jgi:hypothetical protein
MGYVPASNEGRRRILRRLRKDGATSPASARAYEPKNGIERRALERAVKCGVVRAAGNDTYWVDEDRVRAVRSVELRFVGVTVLGVLLLFGILFILGEFP